ncbi:MAG TPA: polymer-forming cytoskeletal protein [Burkholderiales bacterium]|nr:polymer-forming cytoskeletal protein [Burkholderiales bacterium]
MMKRHFAVAWLVLAVLLAVGAPLAGFQGLTIQKDITVGPGEFQDNIFTIGGNAVVDGKVRKSAVAIGGTITVSGEVGDSVVGIGARVVIKSTAVVRRDVVSLGGTLEKEPGCTIEGDTVYVKGSEIAGRIFGGGGTYGVFALSFAPLILFLKLILAICWLVLAVVAAAAFPKPIAFAAGELRKSFWLTFAIGFLAHVAFIGLVIFAALLCIILIGIPVLFALVMAGLAIKVFGRVIVFAFFGESLLRAFGSKSFSTMGAVLTGLLLVTLVSFLPVLGLLFGLFINFVGWGIVIRTKFGTMENIFERKPVGTPTPSAPAA